MPAVEAGTRFRRYRGPGDRLPGRVLVVTCLGGMKNRFLRIGTLVPLVLASCLAGCGAEMDSEPPPQAPPPPPAAPPPEAPQAQSGAQSAPAPAPPPPPPAPANAPAAQPPPAPPQDAPTGEGAAAATEPPPPASHWVYSYPQGQWVYTAEYGWIWVPAGAASYEAEGTPYAYLYTPGFGWTWYISPWGWGPYHYGVWVRHPWRPAGWRGTWVAHPRIVVHMGGRGHFRR
jgi:hypothetical protein